MTKRNVELERLAAAQQALGPLLSPEQWAPTLSGTESHETLGRRIFKEESQHPAADDRRLYWRRLAALGVLASHGGEVATFEAASRGLSDLDFDESVDHQILITGFDPFHLDTRIDQTNPSGVVALQMSERRFQLSGNVNRPAASVQVKTVILPVRYADFDALVVEKLLRPLIPGLSMVITVSMGRDGFDLERFPGRRRSVDTPDNMNLSGGGSPLAPIVPNGAQGPEFIEFSLPAEVMKAVPGYYSITDNSVVRTLESGECSPDSLAALDGLTAVEGSGGGYLSNEISWRVLNTLRQAGSTIPAGHIHTPRMAGFDERAMPDVVAQCCAMIEAATATL